MGWGDGRGGCEIWGWEGGFMYGGLLGNCLMMLSSQQGEMCVSLLMVSALGNVSYVH